MTLSTAEYLTGLVFFAATMGSAGTAAWFVLRRRCPTLVGSTLVLAWAVVTVAAILVAHLVPGALGLLSRETAALAALGCAASAWRLPVVVRPVPSTDPVDPDDDEPASRWLAAYGLVAGAAWLAIAAVVERDGEPSGFDAATAYMPMVARWIQEGSIWGFGDWLPNFFFGATPGNGSTIVLAWMLPWENDFLARYAIYPFLPLLVLATYCLVRELYGRRSTGVLLGLSLAAIPVVAGPPITDALLDPVLYATFAAGLAFLVRHRRTGETTDLVLAGTALGIAFGSKLYGFTAVPIVFGVWVAARLLASDPVRTVVRQGAAFIGLVTAFGGIWVLRNALETGNPVYPVALPALGLDAPPDPNRSLLGSTLLDYVDQPSIWRDPLAHQFRIATGLPLVLLAALAVVAVVVVVRRTADRGFGFVLLCVLVLLTVSYAATPYSAVGTPGDPFIAAANVRYGIPALIAAAGLAGWVTARLSRRVVLAIELLALVSIGDALQIGTVLTRGRTAMAFGIAVPVVVLWALASKRRAGLPRVPVPALAGVAVLIAVVVVVGIGRYEDNYNASRFIGLDPALDWIHANTGDGQDIGIAGAWSDQGIAPIYPAFGSRLQNRVSYIGPRVDGLLSAYTSQDDFGRALGLSGVGILVLGRAEPYVADRTAVASSAEIEAWSLAAGFRPVAQSARFTVLTRAAG